jgi:hypothetical protein
MIQHMADFTDALMVALHAGATDDPERSLRGLIIVDSYRTWSFLSFIGLAWYRAHLA